MKMSSGLSLDRKRALLSAGGLASMYIGFKLASHHDLSRYTICEGPRREPGPDSESREYQYTVCPSHLRYCCPSELYKGERCCAGRSYYTYSPSRGKVIGSLFGTLMVILNIGLVVYFCCLRRRSKAADAAAYHDPDEVYSLPTPHHQFTPTGTAVTIGGYTPAIDPQVHTYPVPVGPYPSYYPENPPPSYFASTGGTQPPPYPDVISPNQPSCPPIPPTDNTSAPPYPTTSTLPSSLPIGSGWRA
ncbi:unnamed protein product [Hymenolepis diminuta]|nr:unnamed protein product [Hymenolepis diminuta]